ncbi:MAG: hypothetical protein AB7V77_00990 [Candidatus Woesearchaeota archaeon]
MKEITVQLKNNVILMPHIYDNTYITMPIGTFVPKGTFDIPTTLTGEYLGTMDANHFIIKSQNPEGQIYINNLLVDNYVFSKRK